MKRAHSGISQNFLITSKIKVIGENKEVESEIRNYILTEIPTFLKDFMQQEGGRGADWFCGVSLGWFGKGSKLLHMAAKMCHLAGIYKDLQIHKFPLFKFF